MPTRFGILIRTVVEATDKATKWSLYLLRTADNSLYTGVSTDVHRRLIEHQNTDGKNKGAKALRGRTPLSLVYSVEVGNRSEALKLEYRVKQLSRSEKEALIELTADLEELTTWLDNR